MIRYSEGGQADDRVRKIDIDMCDESGRVCVRMNAISLRILQDKAKSGGKTPATDTLMLYPGWREQAVVPEAAAPDYEQHVVILCETDEVVRQRIEHDIQGVWVLSLKYEKTESGPAEIETRFTIYARELFEHIRTLLEKKPANKVFVQVVTSMEAEQQLFCGFSGVLKTARLEHPKLIGQLIGVESWEDVDGIIEKMKENRRCPDDQEVRYEEGTRLIPVWSELKTSAQEAAIPYKDYGVYLITGGAGGLGLIFARDIAQRVKDATVILTGRALLNEEKQSRLRELRDLGAKIEYKHADVTDRQALANVIQEIQDDFGSLNGILHSAGVIHDHVILKKSKEEFEAVLSPEVSGALNLDQASQALQLDFFVLFSSIAAVTGNPGQADYACANAFLDAFAYYRNRLVAAKQRSGHTLSINWPLWKDGGMRVQEATMTLMTQSTGMLPMQTSTGIRAFYQGLTSQEERIMVMHGTLPKIKQKLLSMMAAAAPHAEKEMPAEAENDSAALLDHIRRTLIEKMSKFLKVTAEDIDEETELNEYGFDSISLIEFANNFNAEYNIELRPTVFFEHPTINSVAQYLLKEHPALFAAQFAEHSGGAIAVPETCGTAGEHVSKTVRRARFASPLTGSGERASEAEYLKIPEIVPRIVPDLQTRNILLTGVTGVLGANLLKEMLVKTESHIYCLVRAKHEAHAKERIRTSLSVYDPQQSLSSALAERVTAIPGDIADPFLGMSRDREYLW